MSKQARTAQSSASKSDRVQKWIIGLILTVFGVAMILPFLWMILSSFKTEAEIKQIPPTLWPETFTFDSFQKLFTEMDFTTYLVNTLLITLFSFVGLLLNAMAGFGFAKYRFKGRDKLFLLVLATMMIPGQVTMIPVYLILNSMHLTNTMLGIVLPGFISAFGIFLFRQFMSALPDEILEATRLDGAGEYGMFLRIVLPMSKPILAVQAILTFISGWNSFLWPLIIANDEKLYTLSVGLQLLKGQHGTDYALQMAGAAFMVVPIMIIFVFFQKHIIENYNISGMK
ncbi:multiple sugar transport system permease protein [Paenibacillus phyllosphaerae]|uniref:Multiple sugar transport system permease protein n=1 Tax=Paenibacillus phyllosphaerae TaxID=274593 RepID=A0A7W5FPP2_9BACL|nr:carbohydrate ABC transporter permease [Paenibacillus phyllosphaerae]MBB3112585.1 multiple sugar transport system permease protein [Paenibacillus phyllosphaerae]